MTTVIDPGTKNDGDESPPPHQERALSDAARTDMIDAFNHIVVNFDSQDVHDNATLRLTGAYDLADHLLAAAGIDDMVRDRTTLPIVMTEDTELTATFEICDSDEVETSKIRGLRVELEVEYFPGEYKPQCPTQ